MNRFTPMEEHLKQRLVGIAVLTTLAVAFLPMILKGPSDLVSSGVDTSASSEWRPQPRPVPAADVRPAVRPGAEPVPFESRLVPPAALTRAVPEKPAEGTAGVPGSPPPEAARPGKSGAGSVPANLVTAPPAQQSRLGVAEPARADPAKPESDGSADGTGAWLVQLGAFSSEVNAGNLVNRLKTDGFAAFARDVSVNGRTMYRVLVGPMKNRQEADRLQQRLSESTRLKAIVVPGS